MNQVVRTLAVLAGLGVAGGAAVVGFGLYDVSARSGHLPGVSWLLHTTYRNSVKLRAPSEDKVPPLDDPDLIALGAGHYATACAPCHAVPGEPRSATMRVMEPEPPPIGAAVADWKPNELHWIVENGVKMSGMPAWPAAKRGDEVWSVVAYLEAVKAEAAPPVPSRNLSDAAYCKSCHGEIAGPVPRLDLQDGAYLAEQLRAYHSGIRPSGIMAQAVSLVSPDDFDDLAREFARKDKARPAPEAGDDSAGARLARRGTRDVPACLSCHGANDPQKGPVLFGQPRDFLKGQLELWRDGVYDHDRLMHAASRDLSDEDIAELSRYFAGDAP